MRAVTRIVFLDDQNEKFFGEGPARLLRGVEATGSLRASAMAMGMAYTKALKLIRQAEEALGYPLITRTTGGKSGGGSVLTAQGERWLQRYEAYREACIRANQSLYRQFFAKTGCVIMASGMGVRFGGNKLMADFCGAPLIGRALEATEGLFDRRVVVTRHESVAAYARQRNVEVILHDLPHRSDTVRLGLQAVGDVDCCMFLPGDQPLLRRQTVEALLAARSQAPERIIRPACGEIVGSPVLFPAWAFPELLQLPQGKGGGVVIQNHPDAVLTVPTADSWELKDADTPELLEELRQHAVQEREAER